MIKLTKNETELLLSFANCQMNVTNGNPKNATTPSELHTYVWLDERNVFDLSIASKKGVLSSLVKKELLSVFKDSEGDYANFTQLGFDTVMELLASEKKTEELPAKSTEEKTFIAYKFSKISERFGSEDQLSIFTSYKIGVGHATPENDFWIFSISEDQKEDLVKAIRETHIFSRMTIEKLERFLSK
jgi:hypothetical protein